MEKYTNYLFYEETESNILFGTVLENRLADLRIVDKHKESLIGNIYRGRILNKFKNINAVFIDIGVEKSGFLQGNSHVMESYDVGDSIIVQVKSDPHDDKGAVLEYNYELKGEYIILQPFNNSIKVSKKIHPRLLQTMLRDFVLDEVGEGVGVLVRTTSGFLDDYNPIIEELNMFRSLQEKLLLEKNYSPTPKLLLKQNDIFSIPEKYKNLPIIVNNKELFTSIIEKKQDLNVIIKKEYSTKYDMSVYNDIKTIFSRSVHLDNGIELIFDKTEAFNVIDINTKDYININNKNRNLDSANLDSIEEILRQIHLRNLSGIILIDFINSTDNEKQNILLNYIKENSLLYFNPVNIIGFTRLGILELTRRKSFWNKEYTDENFNMIWS